MLRSSCSSFQAISWGRSDYTDVSIIDLPFECDNKGLYDPVSCSQVAWLKTSCPDLDDEGEFHRVKVLILLLEAAAKAFGRS